MIESINAVTCVKCLKCVEACPDDVLHVRFDENYVRHVYVRYPQDCMSCQLCVVACPVDDSSSPSGRAIYVGAERAFRVVLPW